MQGGGTELQTSLRAAGVEPKGRSGWGDLVWCSMRGFHGRMEHPGQLSGLGVGFTPEDRGGFVVCHPSEAGSSHSVQSGLCFTSLRHPSLSAGKENNGSAAVCSHRHCQQHSWNGGRVRQVPLLFFA